MTHDELAIIRLRAELAERDAEIARMNKIWDDAVDYGARVRGALVETREALRKTIESKESFDGPCGCVVCSMAWDILAKHKSLAGELE